MSERYSKLYTQEKSLYAVGSPVAISAYALLKDTMTGSLLAQVKYSNISPKKIKAITVSIQPKDTVGNDLGPPVEYQYLDLVAERDQNFGQKTPVILPDSSTRSFDVKVSEVIFADNTIWSDNAEPWEILPSRIAIDESVKDPELRKQFRIESGQNARYLHQSHKDLWYCTCGLLNHEQENRCHVCGQSMDKLAALDWNRLEKQKAERLVFEQSEQKKKAEEKAEKAKKTAATTKKIAIIALVVAIIIGAGYLAVTQYFIPNSAYKAAIALMEGQNYEDAIIAFEALGDYKDSSSKIEEIETVLIPETKYQEALTLIDNKNYEKALLILKEIEGYKDSNKLIQEYSFLGCSVGDTVWFGAYEQDNNDANGKEPIEWLVLKRDGNKALLLSNYVLDMQPYSPMYKPETWEESKLRNWLNETFISHAFSEAEIEIIEFVENSTSDNPASGQSGGNDTTDRVFVLDYTEVDIYMAQFSTRQTSATDYATAQQTDSSDFPVDSPWWWLRTPGWWDSRQMTVNSSGEIDISGRYAYISDIGVRPVMWIKIES